MESKENFIVSLSAVPFPYGNASDNIIYTFMDGFQEHGCKGEVVCLFPNLPKAHWDEPTVGEFKGVKYRFLLGAGRYNRYIRYIVNKLVNRHRAKKYLKKYLSEKTIHYKVTVILFAHIDKYYSELIKICKDLGARVIMTSCEYPQYLIKSNSFKEEKFREYSKEINKYIFETKTLEDYHKKILGSIDSIVVPPTLPFDDIINAQKNKKERYIAYCGSVHSEAKDGLSNIIMAFNFFSKNNHDVNLKFIGRISSQSYYEELQGLVRQFGLENRVYFSGEVNRGEYVNYLVNAELMMVAKPIGSYYGGGLSSKIIEYLFSGNPVLMVASDDYVNYLTHEDNVYFVQDNQPETMANAISKLFINDDLRNKIAQNGKSYAMTHFNYHVLTGDILKYIYS